MICEWCERDLHPNMFLIPVETHSADGRFTTRTGMSVYCDDCTGKIARVLITQMEDGE